MVLEQVAHDQMMRGAADDTDIVVVAEANDLVRIGDEFGRLAGIAESGQAVGGDTGEPRFDDCDDG